MRLGFSILLLVFYYGLGAQNIFDAEATQKFAQYLTQSKQYLAAGYEYERLLAFRPTDDSVKYLIIKSYRKSDKPEILDSRLPQLYHNLNTIPNYSAFETGLFFAQSKKESDLNMLIGMNTNLKANDSIWLLMHKDIFQWQWAKAYSSSKLIIPDEKLPSFQLLLSEATAIKNKKPWLAAGLSAIVPGLGKVYTGEWKDGILSFVSFGASAWQTYRGFQKVGSKGIYPWVFAALGTGFYFGNIYGSGKSANRVNKKNNLIISEKFKHLYTTYY